MNRASQQRREGSDELNRKAKTMKQRKKNCMAGLLIWLVAMLWMFSAVPCRAFYNPSTGRWLSRDPIAEEGGENVYTFAGNNPCDHTDIVGLVVGTVSVVQWQPYVQDSLLNQKRGWQAQLEWRPPKGECMCGICSKVVWIQEVSDNHGRWKKDWDENDAAKLDMAVDAWDCSKRSTSARLFDIPDQHGRLAFLFTTPYTFRARSYVKCIAGVDAGQIYHTVEWGFTWQYDQTPKGLGPFYVKYELAE
jgi:hypothetical protein